MTTEEHLAQYGLTTEGYRDFILANLSTPSAIVDDAAKYGLTNQILANIYGGVSSTDVLNYFAALEIDTAFLDLELPSLIRWGKTIGAARNFILDNLSTPQNILDTAFQYGMTNDTLALIYRGVTGTNVINYFNSIGLNSRYLDISDPLPHLDLRQLRTDNSTFHSARTFGDFNNDGHTDLFISPGRFLSVERTPLELYMNDGAGNFILDNSLIIDPNAGGIHPRKAVSADFNGDGIDDVIIADHGYDANPFPGAPPILLLSSEDGFIHAKGLDGIVGFHHSVAVGDVDRDGDQDAFFTDNFSKTFFLVNDGSGGMTYDASLTPEDTHFMTYYTSELIDVDLDGFLDLLVGGHEYEGADTSIYWGSSVGSYSSELKTVLPSGPVGHQIVVDIDADDIDGDGVTDIILNRVGSPPENSFYGVNGAYIQILKGDGRNFTDVSSSSINMNEFYSSYPNETWFDWIRIEDKNQDGYLDLIIDDLIHSSDNIYFENNGLGVFDLII